MQRLECITGSVYRKLLLGVTFQRWFVEEGGGLFDPVFEQGQRGAQELCEVKTPALVCRQRPALLCPEGLEAVEQCFRTELMQHLGIEPIELVPIEAGTSFVHPIEGEHFGCLLQGEAFFHSFRDRPAQQGHVIGDRLCCVTHRPEIIDRRHAISFRELAAFPIQDQGCMGEGW